MGCGSSAPVAETSNAPTEKPVETTTASRSIDAKATTTTAAASPKKKTSQTSTAPAAATTTEKPTAFEIPVDDIKRAGSGKAPERLANRENNSPRVSKEDVERRLEEAAKRKEQADAEKKKAAARHSLKRQQILEKENEGPNEELKAKIEEDLRAKEEKRQQLLEQGKEKLAEQEAEREKVRARRHLAAIDDANNMEIGGEGDDNGGAEGGEEEW